MGGGTVGGLEGGAGNAGIGGGREKAGLLEPPAESVRGGGLLEVGDCFCILRGPTVGVFGSGSWRRKSSSSGLPCLRPSILLSARQMELSSRAVSEGFFFSFLSPRCSSVYRQKKQNVVESWFALRRALLSCRPGSGALGGGVVTSVVQTQDCSRRAAGTFTCAGAGEVKCRQLEDRQCA